MTKLICTELETSDSSKYLYLPPGWEQAAEWSYSLYTSNPSPRSLKIVNVLKGKYIFVWSGGDSKLYTLSIKRLSSPAWQMNNIWIDQDGNPITATPTTMDEINLYQTFL